jgi:hypothetical protein
VAEVGHSGAACGLTRPPVKLVARNQLNQVIRALDALADLTTNAFGKSAVFHVIPDERCQAFSHRHDPQQSKDTPAGAGQELGMSPPKQALRTDPQGVLDARLRFLLYRRVAKVLPDQTG